jgi:transposase
MMNQETYVKIEELKKQGWTNKEIGEEVGFHPATIASHLAAGGPPTKRSVPDELLVMNQHWQTRIAQLLTKWPRLLGVSVFHRLRSEGFTGGYSTVTRQLRDVRGPRFRAADRASVPIHTDPGEEAQFDFCDLSDWAARWGWSVPLFCFGMILCWSRQRIWWFTTSQDQHHTFEGMARFFDSIGGVPAACRTDRMGALGRTQGVRFVLHPPAVGFAAHHATAITACKARDAKRKGKVERPFRQLQETFLPEVEIDGIPTDIADLNRRATVWLDERVHRVESRTTGEQPAVRLQLERTFLASLPRDRFDTDYVETRRVHNILPFISVEGSRYSVPTNVLGQKVEIRRPVDSPRFEVRWAGNIIATHTLVADTHVDVWDPAHRRQAVTAAIAGTPIRPPLRLITDTIDQDEPGRLELGDGFDVEPPDLATRYPLDIDDEGGVIA